MRIVTDSTPVEDPKDPSASVIVALYRLVATKDEVAEMEADFRKGRIGYGDFQKAAPRCHRRTLCAAPRAPGAARGQSRAYVEGVLDAGASAKRSPRRFRPRSGECSGLGR
ncbi:MAG: hypothetical protein R3F11_17255 [Verrucomicrobiales bacterium]